MSKFFFFLLFFFSQLFALYCDNNYNFECTIDGTCYSLYYSGCSEDWVNDSIIIRSLSMNVLWRMDKSFHDKGIGLGTEVVDLKLHQGDSVFLEFYSNYGSWIRKIKIDDPYSDQTQFIPDEESE